MECENAEGVYPETERMVNEMQRDRRRGQVGASSGRIVVEDGDLPTVRIGDTE